MATSQEDQIKDCVAAVQTLEDSSQELEFQERMASRIFDEMLFYYKKDSAFCKVVSQLQQSLCEAQAYRNTQQAEQREEIEKTLFKLKKEYRTREERHGH
ncbi:hypothetical protein [Eubacterium sp. 1001713B170207_170306_E7]|uniref:hypothetical protein n=1 Tax=Eubacterium sp. 1001713B170207_170306_E7 TaxID=2787097 RepID=UPI0018984E98|nr:hypothetical protein [Eubacterium sp. 1001713B170207_170306_E7]